MSDIIVGGNAPDGKTGGANGVVKDSTIETFQADVLEASMQVPVIVDFWASWCGPCRTLGPILEAEVKRHDGAVRMVKVDTDKNQMLAQQLRIQSLPTVMAFVAGQPVDGFTGALPESQIKQFIDRILQVAQQSGLGGAPQQADPASLVTLGNESLEQGDIAAAMQAFAGAHEASEQGSDDGVAALAGMARCALAAGNEEQAEQMLAMVPEAKKDAAPVAQVRAMMALTGEAQDPAALAAAEARAQSNPNDPGALYDLGVAQIDAGAVDDGVATLLNSIERDKDWNEGAARQKLLTVFDALSPSHPAVKTGRRRLSSLLFA